MANPTTPLRGATPDWDSNSLDSSQAVQIVKVATTYGGWSAGLTDEAAANRTPQLTDVAELGLLRSDWLGRRDSNPNNLLQRQVSYR